MLYTATQILGAARAEDAVHNVFLKIVEKYNEKAFADLGDKPGRFFVVLVRNHSIDLLRKEKPEHFALDENIDENDIFIDTNSNPEKTVVESEAYDKLTASIRRLKPTARQILEYKYIAEFSNKEIAEMLGISQSAVSTRIGKAKKRLREILESEGVFDDENK